MASGIVDPSSPRGTGANGRSNDRRGRGASVILFTVAATLVVLAGLAAWVFLVGHPGESFYDSRSCAYDVRPAEGHDPEGTLLAAHNAACAAAEAEMADSEAGRRRVASIAGAVVVTVAFAVSTWPSRRLTGESLDGS
jgi:hypothetical protein